jgi:tetraprenyl-beta-curcumene synthase
MGSHHDALGGPAAPASRGLGERVALAGVFALCALRYWIAIFPRTCVELRRWRSRAERIPDPALRREALDALAKRGNIEGAAAFAVMVPWSTRRRVVRALVSFQALYNYADMLAEQSSGDPVLNGRCLHESLLVALDPRAAHRNYYAHNAHGGDGGYMQEMVQACRSSLGGLPSYAAVAAPACRSAARIVGFQSLSLGERAGLERWARTLTAGESGLEWWEAAAAAGSSLEVHALIAAAGAMSLGPHDVAAIEDAYSPWAGALHSLLDSLVDEAEDAATGQLSLVGCYRSEREAATRICWLAHRTRHAARALPGGRRHAVLLAAMACYYLSEADCSSPGRSVLAGQVREAIGHTAGPALLVFRARRLLRRRRRSCAGVDAVTLKKPLTVRLGDGERGVDAGAA